MSVLGPPVNYAYVETVRPAAEFSAIPRTGHIAVRERRRCAPILDLGVADYNGNRQWVRNVGHLSCIPERTALSRELHSREGVVVFETRLGASFHCEVARDVDANRQHASVDRVTEEGKNDIVSGIHMR